MLRMGTLLRLFRGLCPAAPPWPPERGRTAAPSTAALCLRVHFRFMVGWFPNRFLHGEQRGISQSYFSARRLWQWSCVDAQQGIDLCWGSPRTSLRQLAADMVVLRSEGVRAAAEPFPRWPLSWRSP
mmetsp:Transcript_126585/g.300682  ORF Transcript_126585/g.300682 Transcript_126585/m.300682 type:complete len:127 (-) Transcript_126585:180-560(-)